MVHGMFPRMGGQQEMICAAMSRSCGSAGQTDMKEDDIRLDDPAAEPDDRVSACVAILVICLTCLVLWASLVAVWQALRQRTSSRRIRGYDRPQQEAGGLEGVG
jgi:hypothetical protein